MVGVLSTRLPKHSVSYILGKTGCKGVKMANTESQEPAKKFQADDEISMDVIWTIVSWAWAKRYLLLVGVVIGGGIGLVNALTAPKTYTAAVRILPSIDSSSAFSFPGLSSLGMGLGPVPTYEPMFERILLSDSILDGVLEKEWTTTDGSKVFLADIYSIYPESSEKSEEIRARGKVEDRVSWFGHFLQERSTHRIHGTAGESAH